MATANKLTKLGKDVIKQEKKILEMTSKDQKIMTYKEAVKYIVENKRGYYEELKNKIGSDFLEQFELLGYISTGFYKRMRTWSATKFAYRSFEKSFNTESKDSLIDIVLHLIFDKILKIK